MPAVFALFAVPAVFASAAARDGPDSAGITAASATAPATRSANLIPCMNVAGEA